MLERILFRNKFLRNRKQNHFRKQVKSNQSLYQYKNHSIHRHSNGNRFISSLRFNMFLNRFYVTQMATDLSISEQAKKKLVDVLKKEKKTSSYIRVHVSAGGCNGFKINFEIDTSPIVNDDLMIYQEGNYKLVTDQQSFNLIKGAKIDYVTEIARSSFVVANNPNAKTSCGCDSSFSVS